MVYVEYIAGWIAWKFKKANPAFSKSRRENCPTHISDHTYVKRNAAFSPSWIDSISYGGLTKPTEEVMQWVRNMETVFVRIHGDEFTNRNNIKKQLIEEMEAQCRSVPKEVIALYARSRIFMRCKYLNKKKVEEAILNRIEMRKAAKRKLLTDAGNSLDDLSRARSKKIRKLVS